MIGVPFPAELVESLGCHDGTDNIPMVLPGASPQTARELADSWHMCMEIDDDFGEAEPWDGEEPWWHRRWIPWAVTAGGDFQVVNLRNGPDYGRLGWAVHDGGGCFSGTDTWPSLSAYLSDVAEAFRTAGAVGPWHPRLTHDGCLWWSTAGVDELNGEPLTRAPPL